jgi:hypothetical protein
MAPPSAVLQHPSLLRRDTDPILVLIKLLFLAMVLRANPYRNNNKLRLMQAAIHFLQKRFFLYPQCQHRYISDNDREISRQSFQCRPYVGSFSSGFPIAKKQFSKQKYVLEHRNWFS